MLEKIEFNKAVYSIKDLPKQGYPEIILCGRSNVGKSSFINSVFSKKNLAKTSSTPGKTRALNYYLINENIFLVDLPGFGYAKVSKKERDYWEKIINDYFSSNRDILNAFHIVDCRQQATELDYQLNRYLKKNQIPYIVILNKIDKLNQSEKAFAIKRIQEQFPELTLKVDLFVYSSVNGTGRKEMIKIINDMIYH